MELTTLTALAIIIVTLYYMVKRKYSYWERNGIPFIQPTIPYGNFKQFGKIQQGKLIQNFYKEMKGKSNFFGIYGFHAPIAIASDLDFIKNVMIKDFDHFRDRGIYTNEKDDPLSGHLFSIGGAKWRKLRTKLTPTFTSGKMKFMYPTVTKVADEFNSTIATMCSENGVDIEIKEILARFTTDVIGECAFGIECNSLKNPNAEFRTMGRKVFNFEGGRLAKFLFMSTVPNVARFFHMKLTRDEISSFFMGIVKETVQFRESSNVKRNDFMDLLIKLKSSSVDEFGNKLDGITLDEISAQAFVFFLAGFETSSTVMTYALYELALNQEIQTRARKEIQDVLAKHNGEFSYEAMLAMDYIDQILQESLRKYPPVTNLNRIVTKPYRVPGTNFTLEENTKLWIPVYALHHDPEYFPNPDVYDPERFTPEMVKNRNPATYLPFGDGPRNCIGLRFGMMQARVGLVTILSNYLVSKCSQTEVPLKINNISTILAPENGVYLKFNTIK